MKASKLKDWVDILCAEPDSTINHLAERTGITAKTVRSYLDVLESMGIIESKSYGDIAINRTYKTYRVTIGFKSVYRNVEK